MNYEQLKALIDADIKQNGREEITGSVLNAVLKDMVNALGGHSFAGIAHTNTEPIVTDSAVFYIATEVGSYPFFGLSVNSGELAIFYNGDGWQRQAATISGGGGGGDGHSPYIGNNGHWYEWSESDGDYVDTGVSAQGPQGLQGQQGPQGPAGPTGPAGTTTYTDLTDKPSINGTTLSGNKSAADLDLASKEELAELASLLSTESTSRTVADAALASVVEEKIDAPSAEGTAGQVLTLDDDLNPVWDDPQGGGGTSDYDDLANKPSINSVTLSGNKTSSDLGLADKTVVATTQPAGGFLPDAVYNLGELSGTITFALAAAVSGNVNHYFWTFSTGATAPTITWPNGITWQDGSAPIINASMHYEISILNGYGVAMEA